MQVVSGIPNNGCHAISGPGAYEWWYADVLSDNGEWGIVVILFRGMPMSPTYLKNPESMMAGCAVSIYHRGTRIAFSFSEQPLSQATYEEHRVDVAMKGARLHIAEDGALHVHASVPCDADGRSVCVDLQTAPLDLVTAKPAEIDDVHAWVLAAPRVQARAAFTILERDEAVCDVAFDAVLYHDHNLGKRAMHHDYRDWYWGRVHTDATTYVFLATPRSADSCAHVYEISPAGAVTPWSQVEIIYSEPTVTMMGRVCKKKITLRGRSGEGAMQQLECRNTTACEDGPFYQRYISEWLLNGTPCGQGMSEYMDVARMESAWIRPFLRLPLLSLSGHQK